MSEERTRLGRRSFLAGRAGTTAATARAVRLAEIFELHRSRLFGIAYRMLGTRTDAEDVLQDAYLRWHQSATDRIKSPVAILVTITTRLCLDRLRALKKEREHYVRPCLPEPLVEDCAPSPEMQHERADEVSVAFLAVLERLGPEERAAFLLHEVFDYDYPEVAEMIGKSEPSCRQMMHRARARLRESRPLFVVTAESRERLLEKFLAAAGSGDRKAVMALLVEEVHQRPPTPLAAQRRSISRAAKRTSLPGGLCREVGVPPDSPGLGALAPAASQAEAPALGC